MTAQAQEELPELDGPLARVADWPAIGVPHLICHRNWLDAYAAARASIERAIETNRDLVDTINAGAETAKRHADDAKAHVDAGLSRARWFLYLTSAALALNLAFSLARWQGWSP